MILDHLLHVHNEFKVFCPSALPQRGAFHFSVSNDRLFFVSQVVSLSGHHKHEQGPHPLCPWCGADMTDTSLQNAGMLQDLFTLGTRSVCLWGKK